MNGYPDLEGEAPFEDGSDRVSPGGKFEVIRTLDSSEQTLLQTVFDLEYKPINTTEIHWINIFLNGQIVAQASENPHVLELVDWTKSQVNLLFPDFKEKHILSISFIINPAGSQKDQKFHCDYTYTSGNIFIPLTKTTTLNATQYIKTPLSCSRMDRNNNFGDTPESIMIKENVGSIEIAQMVYSGGFTLFLYPACLYV
jgi:hypothetical protein